MRGGRFAVFSIANRPRWSFVGLAKCPHQENRFPLWVFHDRCSCPKTVHDLRIDRRHIWEKHFTIACATAYTVEFASTTKIGIWRKVPCQFGSCTFLFISSDIGKKLRGLNLTISNLFLPMHMFQSNYGCGFLMHFDRSSDGSRTKNEFWYHVQNTRQTMSTNGRRTATSKSDTELSTPDVSMHALAEVVTTEAHEAIAPVKTKLSST